MESKNAISEVQDILAQSIAPSDQVEIEDVAED